MKKSLLSLFVLLALSAAAFSATITGFVTDENGEAVEGAQVVVRVIVADTDDCGGGGGRGHGGGGNGGGFVARVLTDVDGAYTVEEAPAAFGTIKAAKRGLGFIMEEIEVPAEGEMTVDLQLPGCNGEGPGDGEGRGNGNGRRHQHRHQNSAE